MNNTTKAIEITDSASSYNGYTAAACRNTGADAETMAQLNAIELPGFDASGRQVGRKARKGVR